MNDSKRPGLKKDAWRQDECPQPSAEKFPASHGTHGHVAPDNSKHHDVIETSLNRIPGRR